MDDINGNTMNIAFRISFICAFAWFRVLASLTNSAVFGLRITSMVQMIVDIMQFLFIYVFQLLAFSLIGSMAFVYVP